MTFSEEGRGMDRNPKLDRWLSEENLLQQWLIFFRMHPTHPTPPRCALALAKIPHHVG